ncbi:MAG: roadblock/LC7 domain-containing protein [Candidatus Jordarchaeales archaeon]|nr:roadblock/LC7 domain-containing protein [Candidatus Jordarchaeia archaeon]
MMNMKALKEKLVNALEEMEASDPDIEASAVIRKDGLVLASAIKHGDEGLIAAMGAAIYNIGARAVKELTLGNIQRIMVSGKAGTIVIMGVDDKHLLAAVARPDTNMGLIITELTTTKEKLLKLF